MSTECSSHFDNKLPVMICDSLCRFPSNFYFFFSIFLLVFILTVSVAFRFLMRYDLESERFI